MDRAGPAAAALEGKRYGRSGMGSRSAEGQVNRQRGARAPRRNGDSLTLTALVMGSTIPVTVDRIDEGAWARNGRARLVSNP